MEKIYYVELSDGDCYEPYNISVGYFTTLEKANDAAKKCAESELDEGYEKIEQDDGRMIYKDYHYEIGIYVIDLDIYLLDSWRGF